MTNTNTTRLFHNCINEHGHTDNVRNASDKHNLRVSLNNENVVHSLTRNNILIIQGKKVNPTEGEANLALVKTICNKIKDDFKANAVKNEQNIEHTEKERAELQQGRAKLKHKLKKWKDNPKADPVEVDVFCELYGQIGNNQITDEFEQAAIEKLKGLGKSVKKFNNKVKIIEEMKNYNSLVGTQSRNINLSIITKELVFKIPDQYEKTVKPDHLIKSYNFIHKRLYPDFDVIYQTIHCDEEEKNPHIHTRVSGFNNKTKQFDIQSQLLKKMSLVDDRLPKNKKYSELNDQELKLFGEVYQTEVFRLFNRCLNKLDYDFKVEKRTPEEKAADNHNYTTNKRPIAEREHNRQKKVKEENDVIQKETNKLKIDKSELTNEVVELATEKNRLLKLIDDTKSLWTKEFPKFLNNLFNFDKYKNKDDLEQAAEIGNNLKDNNKDAFKYAEESLKEELQEDTTEQLTVEMKKNNDQNRRSSFRR